MKRTDILSFALAVLLMLSAVGARGQSCPCDCDDDGAVRIHELTTAVNIALRRAAVEDCSAADANTDGIIAVNELVSGVGAALRGCPAAIPTPTVAPRPTLEELETARALWLSRSLDHYEYDYRIGCFCFGPLAVHIEVLGGKVVEVRDNTTGRPFNPAPFALYLTVDELFDMIARDIPTAASIRVDYDPTNGHPVDYAVDHSLEIADDELSVSISDLRPVENACVESSECDEIGTSCIEPGSFAGCGVCFPTDPQCQSDIDCGGNTRICEPIGHNPDSCACDPSILVCKNGCTQDFECGLGKLCNPDHHCVPKSCDNDDGCPGNFFCHRPAEVGTGECRRRSCATSESCAADPGVCVNGQCYNRPGRCEPIPP